MDLIFLKDYNSVRKGRATGWRQISYKIIKFDNDQICFINNIDKKI